MFGFRNRKQYNGTVDAKINDGYGIATKDNAKFPGVLAYLRMIDQAWDSKFTEEEAAMYITTLYYSGLMREGHAAEAKALASRLATMGQTDFTDGKISMHRLATFMAAVEKANAVA